VTESERSGIPTLDGDARAAALAACRAEFERRRAAGECAWPGWSKNVVIGYTCVHRAAPPEKAGSGRTKDGCEHVVEIVVDSETRRVRHDSRTAAPERERLRKAQKDAALAQSAPAPAVPAEPARSAGEPDGPVGADGTDDGRPATAPASGETGNDENLAAEHDPGAAALPAGMQTEPETEAEPGGPAGTQDAPAASRAGDGRESTPAGAPGGAADGHDDTGGAPGTGGGTGPGVPGAEAAAGMAELAAAAAQRAAQALAGGDITTALSELDAARDGTAQARRLARAATSRSARAGAGMRPGQLRDRVRDHLAGHPGTSLTPYEIARVLGNSAGAVSNALDRLVELGHAELASEHPRRYITTAATAAAS